MSSSCTCLRACGSSCAAWRIKSVSGARVCVPPFPLSFAVSQAVTGRAWRASQRRQGLSPKPQTAEYAPRACRSSTASPWKRPWAAFTQSLALALCWGQVQGASEPRVQHDSASYGPAGVSAFEGADCREHAAAHAGRKAPETSGEAMRASSDSQSRHV